MPNLTLLSYGSPVPSAGAIKKMEDIMRIFGFVIMKEKRYDELDRFIWNQFERMLVKIGALEFDKKELQKKLKDAEIRIEQLEEMNDGLWEMRGVSVDTER